MFPEITKIWGIPGAGKTWKLRDLITVDLNSGEYKPNEFIICTYGRRIANEWKDWNTMHGIFGDADDVDGHGVIKTIHGVCKRLAGINNVITEKQRKEFCDSIGVEYVSATKSYEIVDEFGLTVLKSTKHLGNLFFDANSFLINNMLPANQITKYQGCNAINDKVHDAGGWIGKTQEQYARWKGSNKCADFDDMLQATYEQGLCPLGKVFVLDECQDITPLMNAIFRELWIPKMEKVYVAGDPRQTIFSYRGANSRFFEELPGTLINLSKSYRLPDNIWNFAKNIITRTGLSVPEIPPTGKTGIIKKITENQYYEMIQSRMYTTNTFHLTRTNHQGMKIAFALINAGIPFSGILGWDMEQKALYTALLKIRNPDYTSQFFSEAELAALLGAYPSNMFRLSNEKIWEEVKKISPPYPFSYLRKLSQKDIFGKRVLWSLIQSPDPLSEAEPRYSNEGSSRNKIMNALQKGGQLTKEDVVVSTIHGVKGSERTTVFLHNSIRKDTEYDSLYERMSPKAQAEANVFYVGATRARQALYIVDNDSTYHYPLPVPEEI
jgi:superfamily I DNA/RNA helicase